MGRIGKLAAVAVALLGLAGAPAGALGLPPAGTRVAVAGIVICRQRPGTAKGVIFVTLEDETGVANVVVWPDMKERFRKEVMGARLMEVRGRVEYEDEVIHVIAQHLTDATPALHALSDDLLPAALARADEVNRPLEGRAPAGGHPRNVRIVPPSRDFH